MTEPEPVDVEQDGQVHPQRRVAVEAVAREGEEDQVVPQVQAVREPAEPDQRAKRAQLDEADDETDQQTGGDGDDRVIERDEKPLPKQMGVGSHDGEIEGHGTASSG